MGRSRRIYKGKKTIIYFPTYNELIMIKIINSLFFNKGGIWMKLERPSMEWEAEHRAYVEEWGHSRMVPSSFSLEGFTNYEDYLVELTKRERGHGKWLPCSNYFLVNENKRVLGMLDIRHELNDYLHQFGGHIGYSVRPSERKKGYATQMLAKGVEKCQELGIGKVLITCDQDNIGSAKVILNNNGKEDYSVQDEDGVVVRRFWISLKS